MATRAGTVSYQLRVAANGTTEAVVTESSSLGDSVLERCIVSQLQRLVFPERDAGSRVTVTVHLEVEP